ncbi:MAG: 2-phosphosulfolactate phosphatase [Planctomycetota bacterium]|jgi:2-phosphosulfolactate phosphatase
MTSQPIVHFEWGLQGVENLASRFDATVIVDVLSFSTAVEVAVTGGAVILPLKHRDTNAAELAKNRNAALAVPRTAVDDAHPFSLSPQAYRSVKRGQRIALPSPNGATLSLAASARCPHVYTGGLRNASRMARTVKQHGKRILVIGAGERWPDGHLRPAFEDLVGAGAILSHFETRDCSPEALAASNAFRASSANLKEDLLRCISGKELIEMGFEKDVEIAAELDAGGSTPQLVHGEFIESLSRKE